jgi:hypothetical protein
VDSPEGVAHTWTAANELGVTTRKYMLRTLDVNG